MSNLQNALQELREKRTQAQMEFEKLNQIISGIESLNGLGVMVKATRPTRFVSAASRRKMARAQGTMGECAERIAVSRSGTETQFRSCQAHHVGIGPQEDRGGGACKVGEDSSGEEGGIGRDEPPGEPAAGS